MSLLGIVVFIILLLGFVSTTSAFPSRNYGRLRLHGAQTAESGPLNPGWRDDDRIEKDYGPLAREQLDVARPDWQHAYGDDARIANERDCRAEYDECAASGNSARRCLSVFYGCMGIWNQPGDG